MTGTEKTPLQRAVAALAQMKARLEAMERAATEPIAIIGMGCRFPAGGETIASFFQALCDGADGVREIPKTRWGRDLVPGTAEETRWAALIDGVETFDAAFFGIAPREAESLDPQQKLLLAVTWETLENAGIRPSSLAGSRTGVFVGATSLDYRERVRQRRMGAYDAYSTTGNLLATAAGRVSYALGLSGPAMVLDTACSSSLVAVHIACTSLRARESDLALAGGVNLLLSPVGMAMAAATQALSPDGRCRTLDAQANGYVRGEGCGMVALKRLSDAERDGDAILSLIIGSAVNQDGRSTGLTVPNVLAQQALLRQALESANVSPESVGYIEMHGTGTALGDPIEFEALRAVLGQSPAGEESAHKVEPRRCYLGSVKTNIGHLESAAGVAGLIKTVEALRRGRIPGNLHFKTLNPRVSLRGTPFAVPTETTSWPTSSSPRRAGVSSFGISGTNAHVIVQERSAPMEDQGRGAESAPRGPLLLPISAKSIESLQALARAYSVELSAEEPREHLENILYTASVRRDHHRFRLAVIGNSSAELREALLTLVNGEASTSAVWGEGPIAGPPHIVFVAPGMGTQWVGMGRELHAEEPVFRESFDRVASAVREANGPDLKEELFAADTASRLDKVDVAQPVLFALSVALYSLWESWGVTPDALLGHSMGEVAAACIAGILTIEDAATVITVRSRLLARAQGQGDMALLELSPRETEIALSGWEDELCVAAHNGSRATVVAGAPAALTSFLETLDQRGVHYRFVKTGVASHSPQMDPLRSDLLAALRDIRPQTARIPIRSTVTGELLKGPEADAGYWVRNLRDPVLFLESVTKLLGDAPTVFVELSPHPALLPAIAETLRDAARAGRVIASMRRGNDSQMTMSLALANLYTSGFDIDWSRRFPNGGRVVPVPTYKWSRERHFLDLEGGATSHSIREGTARAGHPLAGQPLLPFDRPNVRYWEQLISLETVPYLADHRIWGTFVFPATGYLEMALTAASEAFEGTPFVLANIVFETILSLAEGAPRRIQLTLVGEEGVMAAITISSRDPDSREQIRHATLTARPLGAEDAPWQPPHEHLARCSRVIDGAAHLAHLAERRIDLGPAFGGLVRAWVGDGEVVSQVRLPEAAGSASDYRAHPALLDACIQTAASLLDSSRAEDTWAPVAIERFRLHETLPNEVWVHATKVSDLPEQEAIAADISITDEEGRPLSTVERLWLARNAQLPSQDPLADCVYEATWIPSDLAESKPVSHEGVWVVLMDGSEISARIASGLELTGYRVVRVTAGTKLVAKAPDHFEIDITAPLDFERLFARVMAPDKEPVVGVAHLFGLACKPVSGTSLESIRADIQTATVTLLHTVQAIVKVGHRDPPKLFVVTRGTEAAGGDDKVTCISGAPLRGFCRVLSIEHPEVGLVRVDLDPAEPDDEVPMLVRELCADDEEDQIAFREDQRLVARLARQRLHPTTQAVLRDDATYLVTGGLTGLGIAAARWMVDQGARHIVLVGRRPPTRQADEVISEMQRQGAKVLVESADISVPEQLSRVLAEAEKAMPKLRGVIHSAAALHDQSIFEMSEPTFWLPFAGKAMGAWNLHLALKDTPLDFFILYSSAAALLGSPGQANYAAANSFVDALARARKAMGLVATSLAWGPFSEVGLAAAADNRGRRLSLRGIHSFTQDEGRKLLALSLSQSLPELGLIRMSVRQMFDFYPRLVLSPFLEMVRQEDASAAPSPAADKRFRAVLTAMRPSERAAALEKHIATHIERVLRLPAGGVDPHGPFLSYGMDSLMSLEIRHRLEASLGIRLSAAVLYTYPNTASLVDHLLTELELDTKEPVSISEPSPAGSEIYDEMSHDTAAAILDEKLSDLEEFLK